MAGSAVPSSSSLTASTLLTSPLARAERFVWLTARVLEQRRFAHHFLDGGADPVETALTAYRNEDGGYGHALEPELRGPVSQPAHAAHALRVLDEIGHCGGQRAERLCRYLTSASTPDGALPAPHLPQDPAAHLAEPTGDLLATGPVVGVLHRNGVWHAWLFRATDFCWAAVESLEHPDPQQVQAAVAFLDGVPDRPRAEAVAERLGRLVRRRRLPVLEPAQGPDAHHHYYAYDFAPSPDSLARRWFTNAEMDRALDFLAAAQAPDGGWPLRSQSWTPAAQLERRPILTIEALLTLRAYGREVA
ncbi:hypothetical protein [Streptomyces sp. RPT161]|uniref:hypothetical protein n=1 Tax=Streptomyces sp. RPT161 TaxID=3015993 RepID=UPI0022B85DDE|nr:hypothetical protein [Streptomyces sp. RPT161]